MIGTTFLMALRQLRRNKLRTALTSLGILIGVGAVISMVALGQGATRSVEEDLSGLGEGLLFLMPGQHNRAGPPTGARPFRESDVDKLRRQITGLRAVAPMDSRGAVAVLGDRSWSTVVQGTTLDFFEVVPVGLASGRLFEPTEVLRGSDVCVLGPTVATELFGAQEPVGQSLRLDAMTCRIVGVMEAQGQSTFGRDQDDFVLVPLRTLQRRLLGGRRVSFVYALLQEGADREAVKAEIVALLRSLRHLPPGAEDDFMVQDMAEVSSMLASISAVLTGFLATLAGVSLVVGGIGIMNIMTVSVTERTREIGIRLAIGALARDVLLQFLVEAVVLAALGGLVGIAFGVLVSWGGSRALGIPLVLQPGVILGSFVFSGWIGVIFGFVPARRAARMNPIDALRHE